MYTAQIAQLKQDFNDVYDAGYQKGIDEGGDTTEAYNQGFADGKQAEYDRFWDVFQGEGHRTDCRYMFSGVGWNSDNLKPKYKTIPTNANGMFKYCCRSGASSNNYIDFELIKDKFDFSNANDLKDTFQAASIKNLYVDTKSATTLHNTFNCNDGGGLPNITLKTYEYTKFATTFDYGNTTTVTFTDDSVIAENGLYLARQIGMTHDQLKSVIDALSTTTTGLSVTLSLTAVNNAFVGGKDGTEWQTLIATKPNWDIAYA